MAHFNTSSASGQLAENVSRDTIRQIPLDKIKPNPQQPRADIGNLEGLAATIALHGVQQPIRVADSGDGTYMLITGQRRVAASRLAKQATIAAIVSDGRANSDGHV